MKIFAGREAIIEGDFYTLSDATHISTEYFYKPFYDENKKLLNLFGISVDNKGKLDFKTYYLDSAGNRLKSILNDKDLVIRYVKE